MRKLEKREGIIIGIMAIAILYGAFSFLFTGRGKKPTFPAAASSADLQALTSDVTAAIGKDTLSVRDAYVIARAETEWQRDPFMERKTYREIIIPKEAPKPGLEPKKVAFNYTGFMEFKGKRIAIINGVEYTLGETLDTPGYVLRAISQDKVTIENKAGGSIMEVPIQD